jgi:F-type H+-transporting ATPase subunit gamma
MANLKEIRNRIASVSSTMQITNAMKMVSAAKLKKAQDAIVAMRPYADKLTELIQNLSGASMDASNPFAVVRPVKTVLLIPITSNRGLCGAFNSNILKATHQLAAETYAGKQVKILSVGKKGSELLAKRMQVISTHDELFDNLNFSSISPIVEDIMAAFVDQTYDEVVVVYNKFKNAATQIVTTEQVLPLVIEEEANASGSVTDYIYEPSQEQILNILLPKSIKMQVFKAISDSFASEHGARMTAMHKATDNATELRDQLKLTYNKARQAAITNEILEIVGGAEALNN